jgi:FSR family fosmidomycin resistance protein-like MFS transporter
LTTSESGTERVTGSRDVTHAARSGAIQVLTIAGLIGNVLLVPALEKTSGIRLLRLTAVVTLVLYVALLLVPSTALKYLMLALIGLCTTGWFSVLRGKCYEVLPGRSGVVVSVTAIGSALSFFVPLLVGRLADSYGLQWAMWVLALGPLALLIGLPKND